MKIYFTKLLFVLGLCQSPILGICQQMNRELRPTKIQAKSSLKTCKLLSDQIVIPQKESNWCFAAGTQMVLQYYRKPIPSQCEIVKYLLNLSTPCQDSCESNRSNGLNNTLPCLKQNEWIAFFKKYDGFDNTQINGIDKDIIISQLDNCNPVIGLFNNGLGIDDCSSSHVVVIIGYFMEIRGWSFLEFLKKDKLQFLVLDPKKECFGCEYFIEYDGEFKSVENNMVFASKNTKIITFK